jgi:hypothetical protein
MREAILKHFVKRDTGSFFVVDFLVAEDANRVPFGLDLKVVLADAGQLYNRNEVVALSFWKMFIGCGLDFFTDRWRAN